MLDQEDEDLFWQDKVETGLGCLKVGNKLAVHKSLQIFNSSQNTISSLVINDKIQISKDATKANSKSDKDVLGTRHSLTHENATLHCCL